MTPAPVLDRKPWIVASIHGTAGLSQADQSPFLLDDSKEAIKKEPAQGT